jgi:protein-disulfide isomerase
MLAMSTRARWVARHRPILLLLTAVVAANAAAGLHRLGDAPRECMRVRAPVVAACHDPGKPLATTRDDDERVAIPLEGVPHKGAAPEDANVTMVECADYSCPYSKRAAGSVDELLARNDDLAFFHLHFPLGAFAHSVLEAITATAAQRQGRFWAMHDALYDARIESEEDAIALARRLGLDADRFAADLRDPGLRAEVDRQRAVCKRAGVRAVPTFFVNGRRVVGSIPTEQFQRIIDEERR